MLRSFTMGKSLPVSSAGMRRRMSFRIQPSASVATAWALHSSRSMGVSVSVSIRNWWERAWAWILSRKPVFAQDLEMNQEEASVIGVHNIGSWRHVLYKVKSDIRKVVGSDEVVLPQTIGSTHKFRG